MNPATDPSIQAPVEVKGRPTGWLLAFRLIMFLLLVSAALYQGPYSAQENFVVWIYLAATLSFLVLYRRRTERRWLTLARYVGGLQLYLEVAVEGVLVIHSNSITSPYALLFLLTIVSASLYFRLVGTLLVATACCLTVTVAMFVGIVGPNPSPQDLHNFSLVLNLNDDLFYALFLYVCTFFLAAFVSGYLSERLELKDKALEGASEALAQARLVTDDILKNLQSGLLTIDAAGTLVYFNHAAEEILGYREADIKGRSFRDVFGERISDLVRLLAGALESRSGETRTELLVSLGDGRTKPVGLSTSVLGGSREGVRGVIAVFQDLTEAKRLEDRVRVADRLAAVGELSAGIAHEIRNPLATVSGSVEMLQRDLKLDGDSKRLMDMILKESARLNKIVEDFLDFARVKQQSCTPVNLESVVRETVANLDHHPARTPDGQITVEIPSDPTPIVAGTDEQVRQIVSNLLLNALEALPDGKGHVGVSARCLQSHHRGTPQFVELVVEDTGVGIPNKAAARIGQPFFSTKKNGTGLGVAIVQRLTAALNGTVHWESEPGQGTRFVVRLPAYSKERFMQEVTSLKQADVAV